MALKANNKIAIDAIANSIIEAGSEDEKVAGIQKFSSFVRMKTKTELLKERKERYRDTFTWLVIGLYLLTTGVVGFLVVDAYLYDKHMVWLEGKTYTRIVDSKVIIALITGVVVQTAASFAILTRYIYGEEKKEGAANKRGKANEKAPPAAATKS